MGTPAFIFGMCLEQRDFYQHPSFSTLSNFPSFTSQASEGFNARPGAKTTRQSSQTSNQTQSQFKVDISKKLLQLGFNYYILHLTQLADNNAQSYADWAAVWLVVVA